MALPLLAGCTQTTQPTMSPTPAGPTTTSPAPSPSEPATTEPAEPATTDPVETASPETTGAEGPELDPDDMAPFPDQVGEFVNDPVTPHDAFYRIPNDPDELLINAKYDPWGNHGEWEGFRDDEWIDDVWYCGTSEGGMRFCDTQIVDERGALVVMGFDEEAMLAFADELLGVWPYEGFR